MIKILNKFDTNNVQVVGNNDDIFVSINVVAAEKKLIKIQDQDIISDNGDRV